MQRIISLLYKISIRNSLLILCGGVLSTIIALSSFELYNKISDPTYKDYFWKYPTNPIPISLWSFSSHGLLDPITTIKPNLNYIGKSPWEAAGQRNPEQEFNIKTNAHGFFTEYPVNNFPYKKENEIRIGLIGGSGAQGHGATSNINMFYFLLQDRLNSLYKNINKKIRVINLALPGHEMRNNSLILREVGQALNLDMILAYNGANDIIRPSLGMVDILCEGIVKSYMNATYIQPDWVKKIGEYFPALVYKYGLGKYIKTKFYFDFYNKQAMSECYRDLGINTENSTASQAIYENFTKKAFEKSIKAIKRDFCGIPIIWALQAIHAGDRDIYEKNLAHFNEKTNPPVSFPDSNSHNLVQKFPFFKDADIYVLGVSDNIKNKPVFDDVVGKGKSIKTTNVTDIKSDNNDVKYTKLYYADISDKQKNVFEVINLKDVYANQLKAGIYQEFFKDVRRNVDGYMNKYWYFINVDSQANSADYEQYQGKQYNSVAVHLDDVGHQIVTEILSKSLKPIIDKHISSNTWPKCVD